MLRTGIETICLTLSPNFLYVYVYVYVYDYWIICDL